MEGYELNKKMFYLDKYICWIQNIHGILSKSNKHINLDLIKKTP